MTSHLLRRPLGAAYCAARVAASTSSMGAAAACAPCAATTGGLRAIHAAAARHAPGGPKTAGGGSKKKKEVVAAGPMHVPVSMSEYGFAHLNVLKEYKEPATKAACQPDSAYPEWMWDQTPEPTWSDLLLADFQSLPPQYQKKVFSMPRKQEIKKKNDLSRKG